MLNAPNLLSITRMVLIIPFIVLLAGQNRTGAFWVYIVAALTDAVDGALARLLKQRTTIGAYLDPAADKVFMTASFIALAALCSIPVWLAILVISRDIIIVVGLVILRWNSRRPEVRPSLLSKATTLFQLVTIGAGTLFESGMFKEALILLTALATVISGLQYIRVGFKILNGEPKIKF